MLAVLLSSVAFPSAAPGALLFDAGKTVCYETRGIDQGGSGEGHVCIPAGEHIVFAGDSTMRYQYEHLAYAVRHGHEAPMVQRVKRDGAADLLGDVGDERTWEKGGDDYSQSPGGDITFRAFFNASAALINDDCDCFVLHCPQPHTDFEHHFFRADDVQISSFSLHGRLPVHGNWLPGEDTRTIKPAFEFAPRWTLDPVNFLTNVLAKINATVVIWNQGLWLGSRVLNADEWKALHSAVENNLRKQGVRFLWKTTHHSAVDYCLPPLPFNGQSRPPIDRARIEAEAKEAGSRFEVFPAHEVTSQLEAKDWWDGDMKQPHVNPPGNHRLNRALLTQLYGGKQQKKLFRKDLDCPSVRRLAEAASKVQTGNESISPELPPISPHQ